VTQTRTITLTPSRTVTVTRTSTIPPTPTLTPLTIGAEITAFGIARADGQVVQPICPGCTTFVRPSGSGFYIFVEGGLGISRRPVGTDTFNSDPNDPTVLPDLQIFPSRALGNGSPAVCDDGPAPDLPLGGVPGVNPPMFGGTQQAANAINDLSCRFDVRGNTTLACTRDPFTQMEEFVGQGSTVQFCTTTGVGTEVAFPPGDTTLTVRVRDVLGQPGHAATIVIRIPTPTPTVVTPTPTRPH
jgi:hypothetical protein